MVKTHEEQFPISGNQFLIKNIRIVDGSRHLDEPCLDILVSSGKIEKITPNPMKKHIRDFNHHNVPSIDGSGLWLWPGLVDPHVHLREPGYEYKETFASGCRAAAHGGYTTVICEPNTRPPLASAGTVSGAAYKAKKDGCIKVFFKAAMTHNREGRRVSHYGELKNRPEIVALSDDGDPVSSALLMENICREAAKTRFLLSPHCEDSERVIQDYASGACSGFKRFQPYHNETLYVRRDAQCALNHGCRMHFSHLSLASSIDAITDIKKSPAGRSNITCEVTPHHLLLSECDYPPGKAPSVNPPLRTKDDVAVLQEALKDGRIDAVGSDHAPHTEQEKKKGAMGLLGLETTLGLLLTYFVKPGHLTPSDACRLLSSAPAAIFNLPGGTVDEGRHADLVLIDPHRRWVVDANDFYSQARNTPFEGHRLIGKAVGTVVNGHFVYTDNSLQKRIINAP